MTTHDIVRLRARATVQWIVALGVFVLPLVLAACGGDDSGGGGGAPGY